MAKVTGIGGIFFKAKGDHKTLAAWYQEHLGVPVQSWGGAVFRWGEDEQVDKGSTAWSVAKKDSDWFSPGDQSFMVNYRVDDLTGLLTKLKAAGVKIVKEESHEQGKFAWILDPEGTKVELWEPASKG